MEEQKRQMIDRIKFFYGLDSPVVFKAALNVPRHKFVRKELKEIAYSDSALDIGFGQTISQPYTVCYMTHLLIEGVGENKLKKWKVLEIGTGSGYQAAILSEIVGQVFTIEIIPQLYKRAKNTLKRLGYKNILVKKGSGEWGWEEKAPFDAIIITAALEGSIPKDLVSQLKVGGVIIVPIGTRNLQTMFRIKKISDRKMKKEKFQKYIFVPFVRDKN